MLTLRRDDHADARKWFKGALAEAGPSLRRRLTGHFHMLVVATVIGDSGLRASHSAALAHLLERDSADGRLRRYVEDLRRRLSRLQKSSTKIRDDVLEWCTAPVVHGAHVVSSSRHFAWKVRSS